MFILASLLVTPAQSAIVAPRAAPTEAPSVVRRGLSVPTPTPTPVPTGPTGPTVRVRIVLQGGGGIVMLAGQTCQAGENEIAKTCEFVVPKGKPLYAVRSSLSGYGFDGWYGECAGQGNCQIPATHDTVVMAEFTLADNKRLTVHLGNGQFGRAAVSVSPQWKSSGDGGLLGGVKPNQGDVTYYVRTGTTVQVRGWTRMTLPGGQPLPGGAGKSTPVTTWGGACAGTVGEVCTLLMSEPREVSFH